MQRGRWGADVAHPVVLGEEEGQPTLEVKMVAG
jgi:hypothetical protein